MKCEGHGLRYDHGPHEALMIQDVHFAVIGHRAVLHSARHDEQLARPERHVAVAKLDREAAV